MSYYEYKFKSMCAVRAKPYIVIKIQKAGANIHYTLYMVEYRIH